MYARQRLPEAVLRLAEQQCGVISRAQAIGLGVGRSVIARMIRERLWVPWEAGVYLAPAVEPSWRAMAWAGVLMGGPDARLGGRTAALLQGLQDDEPSPLEVLVPLGTRLRQRDWVVFRQERPGVRAVSAGSHPPRTRIEDTVLDLCAAGSGTEAVEWVTKAVQRRLTTPEALVRALHRRSRTPHRKMLTDLLTDVAAGVHSALEHRYLHDVERAHGLPRPVRQASRTGRTVFVDVLYRDFGLIVELDGRVGHVEEGRWRDRRRDNVHAASGALTLRFGWHEIADDPCAVARDVADALIRRGWTGYPARCSRCPLGHALR